MTIALQSSPFQTIPRLKVLQSVAISSNDTLRERLQDFFDDQWLVFIWGGHYTHQETWQCIHMSPSAGFGP